ncbi:uncharacterized protein LOC114243993 [Bombyx mandarina]|uniref:Uncharacterized protein LOC114243993 n=1 Tax=Bombyx mandarina TaxID=7092 RepID=A0A6J2JTB0_BOMMA|nr:uncharacterized protein LOC114243993 [Bombyx mandarina]
MLLSYFFVSLLSATLAGPVNTQGPVLHSAQVKIDGHEAQAIHTTTGGGGVSSVAGISSRNGRVTSYSGIYSHSDLDTPAVIARADTRDLSSKTSDGKPLYITKEIDNEFTKGTVKISPGSVSVTSISKSRSAPGSESWRNTLLIPMMPIISNPFLRSSISTYDPRFNPWFPQELYGSSTQKTDNRFRSNPFYPNFYTFYNNWQ